MRNGTVLPHEEHPERKRRHSSPSACSSQDGSSLSTKLCNEPAPCISSSSLVFTLLPVEERIQASSLSTGAIPVSKSTNGDNSTELEKKKSPFYFGVEGVRIGRDPEASDLSFPFWNGVSRLHCVISVVGFHVYIRDLSLNGTFVNGRYVGRGQSVELTEGDMIAVCNPFLPHAASYAFIFTSPSLYQMSLSNPFSSHSRILSTFPSLFPQYSLGVVVGHGVYATVYAATDVRTGDSVAIKLLKKNSFSTDIFETAMRLEVEVLRSLQHPHIIRLLDTLTAPGLMALVMELVPGGDLFDYVVSRGKSPFTEQEARFLFRQIVEAVRYMHSKNIIHCDLKPENVVIAGLPNRVHLPSPSSSFQAPSPETTESTEKKAAGSQEVSKKSSFSPFVEEENVLSLEGAPSSFSRPPPLLAELSSTSSSTSVASNTSNLLSPSSHGLSTTGGISVLDWQLKIIDFGVAQYFKQHVHSSQCTSNDRLSSEALSVEQKREKKKTGGVHDGTRSLRMVIPTIGTPAYAAPELVQWSSSGLRADAASATTSTSFPLKELPPSDCSSSEKNISSFNSEEEGNADPYTFAPSPALDMWSLGVLLYILCSGSRPKKRRMSSEPLFFHKHMGGLTKSCKELLGALLTVNPRKRMTMGELLAHRWWNEGGIYFSSLERDVHQDEIYFPSGTSSPTSPRYNAFF